MGTSIIGWGHTRFGKLGDETVESLIQQAALEAVRHAGIEPDDVDEIVVGHFNAGFSVQNLTAGLATAAHPGFRFKPATRVENACASGSAAVFQGVKSILAKQARFVLVVGVEKMTHLSGPEIGRNLLRASYVREEAEVEGGFAGLFGGIAEAYFQRYGSQLEALAMIAEKNHANGVHNPYAQIRKPLDFEFCRHASQANPVVAGPLKRSDCSPVSDGAAAILLCSDDVAAGRERAVRIRAASHVQDFLPMSRRDVLRLEGCGAAWRRALGSAGLRLDDLSFVETHDCFTIAELIEYEAMGLTQAGQGARAISEGWTRLGGRLPVNPSGGLKSKGHPIGATGVSMLVMSAIQLAGEAPPAVQVDQAGLAGVFNMGGVAVANYVTILERSH